MLGKTGLAYSVQTGRWFCCGAVLFYIGTPTELLDLEKRSKISSSFVQSWMLPVLVSQGPALHPQQAWPVQPHAQFAANVVTDCEITYSNAEILPPNSSWFAYNPSMIVRQGRGVIGSTRVQMVLGDNHTCQQRDTNGTPEGNLKMAGDITRCRWELGMYQSRDLIVEWEASLDSPCHARMVRVMNEGEDPRLFHSASGAILSTYEHFEAWTVDGMELESKLAIRPLLLYEWGSELLGGDEGGVMPRTARLVYSGAHTLANKFLLDAMSRNPAAFGNSLELWGEVQSLLSSCRRFEDTEHMKCAHNGGYSQPSFQNFTRAPVACDFDCKRAAATRDARLDLPSAQTPSSTAPAQIATNRLVTTLGAFTNGVGFFSDKNWSPFEHNGTDYMVTWLEPFVVCSFDGNVRDSLLMETEAGGDVTATAFFDASNDGGFRGSKNITRRVSTMGCGQCNEVSASSNATLVKRMLRSAANDVVRYLDKELGLPAPDLRVKGGDDGIHLNGVPFVKVENFLGHEKALLGVAHVIYEASWMQNWTQAMQDKVYGESAELRGKAKRFLEQQKNATRPGGPGTFTFEEDPGYDGLRVISSYSTGDALLYVHYFTLATAAPPFRLLDISAKPIPMTTGASSQPWFEVCDGILETVATWVPWSEGHDEICGLSVAFASGFERNEDTLMLSCGIPLPCPSRPSMHAPASTSSRPSPLRHPLRQVRHGRPKLTTFTHAGDTRGIVLHAAIEPGAFSFRARWRAARDRVPYCEYFSCALRQYQCISVSVQTLRQYQCISVSVQTVRGRANDTAQHMCEYIQV